MLGSSCFLFTGLTVTKLASMFCFCVPVFVIVLYDWMLCFYFSLRLGFSV